MAHFFLFPQSLAGRFFLVVSLCLSFLKPIGLFKQSKTQCTLQPASDHLLNLPYSKNLKNSIQSCCFYCSEYFLFFFFFQHNLVLSSDQQLFSSQARVQSKRFISLSKLEHFQVSLLRSTSRTLQSSQ